MPTYWLHIVFVALALLLASGATAYGQERLEVVATSEPGYGRLVLSFPDRLDLPEYALQFENGILVVEFENAIKTILPDVSGSMQNYVAIARIDPDGKGMRLGLKSEFRINTIEAGERLFLDLLPANWQGLVPGLPIAVVSELAERARVALILAERQLKAEMAERQKPRVEVRVGRHPTFMRVQFNWTHETEASYTQDQTNGEIKFSWPVPVELYPLLANLPGELVGVSNNVTPDGSFVRLMLAEDAVPRFYALSPREFVLDIDLTDGEVQAVDAETLLAEAGLEMDLAPEVDDAVDGVEIAVNVATTTQVSITPRVTELGSTIRVSFPFEIETAAAVFRRADTVWMLFDTPVVINAPNDMELLGEIANGFTAAPAGNTQIVRIDLASERLATLGSEGRAWVLSLGDMLLTATEPMALVRQHDESGKQEILADLERPANVHQVRDPLVGDMLEVVTAYPPARGVVRTLNHVDFSALRSVHGLVIKPWNDDLEVTIADRGAVISTPSGLTLSDLGEGRATDSQSDAEARDGFLDLVPLVENLPRAFVRHRESIMHRAAVADGAQRDIVRLEMAQFFLANQLAYEALGVLGVLQEDLVANTDLGIEIEITHGAALALTGRNKEALVVLNQTSLAMEADALLWRTIAKVYAGDFAGARLDALAAEPIAAGYPNWTQTKFYLTAARAAVEEGDADLAERFLGLVEFGSPSPEAVTSYQLLSGRIDAIQGRFDEALDTFGQVIAADVRPTRVEAIYETLMVLDKLGQLDVEKAADTLAGQAMVWRGDALEAKVQALLADLYFRSGAYRQAFEIVRQAARVHTESEPVLELVDVAGRVFADLYIDGVADTLEPIEALSLYYDFRHLTPPGARGDEMIRNLARRLVKVDLLAQAADLLEYQIDNRLKGAARAQIAADLAVINIANRAPEAALKVLNRTSLANLPPELSRQRRLLEAKALADAGRDALALDVLGTLSGRDADLLRVEAYWHDQQYRKAAELLEVLYAPVLGGDIPSASGRLDLVKAAVGFVLANDELGLSRLRSKYSDVLAQTPEWAMFDFVTGPVTISSLEFRKVAREIASIDTVDAFLAGYRATYGADGVLVPEGAMSGASDA